MVQVILGERHGAGTKIGARCIWDADTDTQASDQFLNVNLLKYLNINFLNTYIVYNIIYITMFLY